MALFCRRFHPEMKPLFVLIPIGNLNFKSVFKPGNGLVGDGFDRQQDSTGHLQPGFMFSENLI